MSPWVLPLLLLALLYGLHVRALKERLRGQEESLRRSEGELARIQRRLSRRGRRSDVLFSSVSEAVFRIDRLGRVMAANERARELFRFGERLELPQSMLVFYRDLNWHAAFAAALKRLPEPSALPDIRLEGVVLAVRLAPLGKDQALMLCVDMTRKAQIEAQQKTFIANLMHDLKTPLTSLLGYARTIHSFGDDPALRNEAAEVIATEAKHVNSLLDTLLTLDQIEHEPVVKGSCDPAAVCEQVAGAVRVLAEEKRVTLGCEPESGVPEVAMNEESLQRALINLAENAIHYGCEGGNVTIRTGRAETGIFAEVADDGPGIPKDQLEKVTERFYRIDAARGRGGHGLGLAIVRSLAERSGGKLILANREPHGLVARIELPAAATQSDPAE